jgi:hypothetical protein
MQTLTPDRHGTLGDAAEKMIGGAAGAVLMAAALDADQFPGHQRQGVADATSIRESSERKRLLGLASRSRV